MKKPDWVHGDVLVFVEKSLNFINSKGDYKIVRFGRFNSSTDELFYDTPEYICFPTDSYMKINSPITKLLYT